MKLIQQGTFNLGPHMGYRGHAEYDSDAGRWHGEVTGLRDVVTFQGRTIEELTGAFLKSVEDYQEFCKSRGEEPERPYSGRFVVRIPPEVHAKISTIAESTGISLNELVATRLKELAETPDAPQLNKSSPASARITTIERTKTRGRAANVRNASGKRKPAHKHFSTTPAAKTRKSARPNDM